MKYKYIKLKMVDNDNEQIYLENILNIINYRGQNIKIKDKKLIFIKDVKEAKDFSISSDVYNILLESYSHFFNTYTQNTIDNNILNDIKKSLKGIERLSQDNFTFKPIVDYIEIELINFLSSNRKRKIRSIVSNSTYRKDSAYSSENSTDSDTMDGDFCILDIDVKKDNLHKRKNIKNNNDSKDEINTEKNIQNIENNKDRCDSVVIDIKREVPEDIEFEDYYISERIQKFLSAATNEICNFCNKHLSYKNNEHNHTNNKSNIDDENKKETIGSKLKSICSNIKKSFKTISLTNCFSGMSCICCSEIDEEEKHITDEEKSIR